MDVLARLGDLAAGMRGRDLLLTWELSMAEIEAVTIAARLLGDLHGRGRSLRIFDSGLALAIFRDRSTRTRHGFASASNALGLMVSELDEDKSQVAHGETVRETAIMISFLTEVIGIRDDMFLGEGNRYMRQVAAALDEGAREGVLARRPTIVNLQCDVDHPTQTLADLMMLEETFGSLEALRGRRIAMSWAYSPSYGKPLSVPQGVIGLMTRLGMDVVLAHPEGYDLVPGVVDLAARQARESGGSFAIVGDMDEAFRDADVVYPKSWAPTRVMETRTELLHGGDRAGLADLERECLETNRKFVEWQCDEARMALTRGGEALYMHCLPADITGVSCERGEVTAGVFERYRVRTYREAGFKPFVIAAAILLSRMEDPAATLAGLE
jgi:knotted carbamoyltransferase YgeW